MKFYKMKTFKILIMMLLFVSTNAFAQQVETKTQEKKTIEEQSIKKQTTESSSDKPKVSVHTIYKSAKSVPPEIDNDDKLIVHSKESSKSETVKDPKSTLSFHRKKKSPIFDYITYKHDKALSTKGEFNIKDHSKEQSKLDMETVTKHNKRPSKKGEWEDKVKF